jgi:predicted enzyme related to lactoylglutathione lyase
MAKAKAKTKAKPKKKAPAKKVAPKKAAAKKAPAKQVDPARPQSLRSAIYQVDDLARAKTFYTALLGKEPYFDQPFYVGYDLDGQELGLHPDLSKIQNGPGGCVAYWRVGDCAAAYAAALAAGGTEVEAPHDVGEGIVTAVVGDPATNLVGLISGAP